MSKHESYAHEKAYSTTQMFGIPLLMGFLTVLVYYSSLFYGFIFDDFPTIIQYFHIRIFDPMGMFFANTRWISRILNQFTYHYWQTDPFAYRVIDLAMHIAIGLMIFYILLSLLSRFTRNDFVQNNAYFISLLTAGLFLLHPVQTQTATYITQMRLEGLVALFSFFVIATFIASVHAPKASHRILWLVVSYLGTSFAAGTKEIIIVLPVLLVLVDWFFIAQGDLEKFKTRLWVHAGYFAVLFGTLAYMGIRPGYVAHLVGTPLRNNRGNVLTGNPDVYISTFSYLISQFKVMLHYMLIFVWPFRISFDYDMRLAKSLFSMDVIVPATILLSLTWWTFKRFMKNKADLFVFAFAWFLIAMLPRTSIFPSTELICDYKTYLASFGAMFALAIVCARGVEFILHMVKGLDMIINKHVTQVTVGLLMLSCIGFASNQQNKVWSSDLNFWQAAVDHAPTKARAHNNLATAMYEKGDIQGALKEFDKAIECDGNYGEPHVNLASIHQMRGDFETAIKHYARAMDIGEAHPEMFHNLGILHLTQENNETAADCFKQAIDLKPYYSSAHKYLGKVYQLQGKREEALKCYQNALAGDQPDDEVHYLKGTLNVESGNFAAALESFEKVSRNYLDIEFQLGCAYYGLSRYDQARGLFQKSYAKEPTNLVYTHNYAQTLLNCKEYAQALPLFEQCLKATQPGELPYLPLHIAKCKFFVGQRDEASKALNQLAKSAPQEVRNDAKALMQEIGISEINSSRGA